jgi:hypothetical protein
MPCLTEWIETADTAAGWTHLVICLPQLHASSHKLGNSRWQQELGGACQADPGSMTVISCSSSLHTQAQICVPEAWGDVIGWMDEAQ